MQRVLERPTDRGRVAVFVGAACVGAVGVVLLVASAGFLFLVTISPAGSEGWLTALALAGVTGVTGSFALGHACRIVFLHMSDAPPSSAGRDVEDDDMWLEAGHVAERSDRARVP